MKTTLLVAASVFFINTVICLNVFAENNVDVFLASTKQSNQTLALTGTIEAKQNAQLAPLQAGVIDGIDFEVGDVVSKGQKLIVLDTQFAKLAVQQAKAAKLARIAEKDEAKRLYSEVIELSKKQLVAKTQLNERLSRLEIANAMLVQAEVELARSEEVLSRHTLYAPFSGVISQRYVDVGEWVTQQTPVLTLVQQHDMRLNIAIPQEYYSQLADIDNVEVLVTPDFNQSQVISANLDRLVAVASDTSRTITGLVELPNNRHLVAGMSAHAQLIFPQSNTNLVWLPKTAIKQHPDGGASVFVVSNNVAQRVLIKVVKTQGQQVAISGVDASKPFVMSGVELLKDGDVLSINKQVGGNL